MTFVERHGLWSEEQREAARSLRKIVEEKKLETIRLSFADQHGILRGKTLIASEALASLESGCGITTSLLAKDTSHKTVFPVFTAGGGFGLEGDGRRGRRADGAGSHDVSDAAVVAGHRLGAVRPLFRQRQAGAVLDAPALSLRREQARRARL